jgi:hypothetical protein
VIGAPAGGGVLNASNLADQDMLITLSGPGASDKKTYFGPSTNTNLTLGVGGVEKMRINSAGYVGIGTTAPAATLEVNGTTKFDGRVTFPNGVSSPIAYGFVLSSGAITQSSTNVSCTFDSTHTRYVITISGVNYFYSDYVTVVTPTGVGFVRTDSVGGNLLVYLYDTSGAPVTGNFQFVTFH